MAVSTRLIRRLEGSDINDEPLAKRLKLAENVLCSPDTLIVRKEDCVFRWLCNELSSEINDTEVWMTIHRCLSLDPKNVSRLALTTKTLLIEKLIGNLKNYPDSQVSEEMLKCCSCIFSSSVTQSYSREDLVLSLIEASLEFAGRTLKANDEDRFVETNVILECAECAVSTFSQSCRQSFSEKKNFMIIFTEKLLFPVSLLTHIMKEKKLSSKITLETQKCIKRLLLGSLKNITSSNEANIKILELEIIFDTLKSKLSSMNISDVKIAFTYLFQSVVNIFHQNSSLIDAVLRKLVNCTTQKDQSKQILTVLIENSIDVSFNFDNEIDGVSLRAFLKNQIEQVLAKKKNLKCFDYELLTIVAKLNPVIVEDLTQNIMEKILFAKKKSENEEIARKVLIKELWKSSVRLRRHHKFISKFLLTINSNTVQDMEELQLINKFVLPTSFIVEFSEDLKSKTTSAQIMAIFLTLIYHFKSDCVDNLSDSSLLAQKYLMIKVVAQLFITFFESSNFLDSSLPRDWQIKFYNTFSDLRNSLALFGEKLCEIETNIDKEVFVPFSDMIKTWCEVYDLLHNYLPHDVFGTIAFPIQEANINELQQIIKKSKNQDCKVALNQLLFFEIVIYNKDNQESIKDKMIQQLWSLILENHFEIVESFDEKQMLELTLHLVHEACNSQEKLLHWTLHLKKNSSRLTKKFATALILQVTINLVEDVDLSTSKTVTEKIDFISVLQSLGDSTNLKNVFKKAMKEFSKQNFKSLDTVDIDKVKRNLVFLSNLPLSFLDTDVKTFLFMVLYTFEEEIQYSFDVKDLFTNLYLDFLCHDDVNILDCVAQPAVLIHHFKDNELVLFKIVKLSISSLSVLKFWKEFVKTKECTKKMSSMLIVCIDSVKGEASSNEHKSALHDLFLKLSSKITKELDENVDDADEIAGLRIALKVLLLEKKKLKDNLKKLVQSVIKNVVKKIDNVCNDKLAQEILQLSLIVLSHREDFVIDEDEVKKLCVAFIKSPNEKIFFDFLGTLKDKEFDYFSKSLGSQTKNLLISGDVETLEKVTVIWDNLSKAEVKMLRSKSLKSAVNTYFNELLSLDLNEASPTYLLKICRAIARSKIMIRFSDDIIDFIFVMSIQCLDKSSKDKLNTCQEALGLCLDFLRSKSEFSLDRLFALTTLFCTIVQVTLQVGKEINFSDEQTFRILAVDIEKFCTFFAKLKKHVTRISSYLIADLIDVSLRFGVLPTYLKASLDSSICHLLSNCDQYAISFLSRTLPVSTQQVFKSIYDNYKKYHKFTGKI